jgi:nitrate reductase NapAB chaperone NapD
LARGSDKAAEDRWKATAVVVLGAIVRLELNSREAAIRLLNELPGVSTFSLNELGRVGLVLEAESIDAAHLKLRSQVQSVPGVLVAWPVFVECEETDPCQGSGQQRLRQAEVGGGIDEQIAT